MAAHTGKVVVGDADTVQSEVSKAHACLQVPCAMESVCFACCSAFPFRKHLEIDGKIAVHWCGNLSSELEGVRVDIAGNGVEHILVSGIDPVIVILAQCDNHVQILSAVGEGDGEGAVVLRPLFGILVVSAIFKVCRDVPEPYSCSKFIEGHSAVFKGLFPCCIDSEHIVNGVNRKLETAASFKEREGSKINADCPVFGFILPEVGRGADVELEIAVAEQWHDRYSWLERVGQKWFEDGVEGWFQNWLGMEVLHGGAANGCKQ